jgi:membrane protein
MNRLSQEMGMFQLTTLKQTIRTTLRSVQQKHTSQLAAGLSYYFVLALFPALIAFAAAVSLLPIPHLFDQILALMARIVPADSMGLVRGVLKGVASSHGRSFLSLGIALTIWAASGGFVALIEALNIAYGLEDKRSFLHRRILAIGLSFGVGTLMTLALSLMVLGPDFGRWLAAKAGASSVFASVWPYLRWGICVACAVLSIEVIYAWGPSGRRSLRSTFPGACIAVVTWVVLSSGLGLYLRSFTRLNKTYGVMAAGVALLLWLNWTAFSILVGAEINANLEAGAAGETKAAAAAAASGG